MIYGYARVSTAGQAKDGNSLDDQTRLLKEAGATEIYSEHYTGAKMDRPEFQKLLAELKPGDTLVVTKLDRFARNASEGYTTIKGLLDRKVSVNILNMGMANDTAMGHLMLQIILAFGEFEKEMIKERTAAGKAIARQKPGYKEGRKPVSEDIIAQIQAGVPYTELGISRAVWYKYRKEAMN
jgi:DNA invertase Pin-like site-specific DNA recombinase